MWVAIKVVGVVGFYKGYFKGNIKEGLFDSLVKSVEKAPHALYYQTLLNR